MLTRLRSTWLAGGGAVLLVLSISGMAAGAALVADTAETVVAPVEPLEGATDTTLTFEDIDGNGVDDDCQDVAAVADPVAAAAALAEADTDGDGTISVTEAAHSGWTGGKNCNHGGYVSGVARASGEACDETETPTAETDEDEAILASTTEQVVAAVCDQPADETDEDQTDAPKAECPAPVSEPAVEEVAPVDTAPNAHGKAVSEVAGSDAVGGKNCNHGGAVSQAAKKDHSGGPNAAAKQAGAKGHGKGNGKGHGKP